MEKKPDHIINYKLDPTFYNVHKARSGMGDFGLDSTNRLVTDGFGLYSSAGLKQKIGPIKSAFYRIGFCVRGSVHIHCGLETFQIGPGYIAFTFPGQIFSMQNKSDDLLVYYMLFSEAFIDDALPLKKIREDYAFLNYSGIPCFKLDKEEATEIQNCILKINDEIKLSKTDLRQIIQLYIHLILLHANRGYARLDLKLADGEKSDSRLLPEYKKLVSEHFMSERKVSTYADMLHVTSNHLNKVIKKETGKTAHELIEEMILLEAKALVMHTAKSIAEIAYQLNFNDPSHFNKFFKKMSGMTPRQYRQS